MVSDKECASDAYVLIINSGTYSIHYPMKNAPSEELLPRVKVGHLTTADGILTELRSLYRDARRGELRPSDATKLTYILKTMSEVMTLRELEARLDCLESGKCYTPRLTADDEHQDPADSH
jgi:hypothetical protein